MLSPDPELWESSTGSFREPSDVSRNPPVAHPMRTEAGMPAAGDIAARRSRQRCLTTMLNNLALSFLRRSIRRTLGN
ncbi:hypothetical protein MIC448_1140011 [Microbacterium sp. C448]|nr:hypothetical protein MIC448_1140011 [Microbacterium sp. C448]